MLYFVNKVHIIFDDVSCGKTVCRMKDPNQQPRRLGAGKCVLFVSCAFVPHLEGPTHLAICWSWIKHENVIKFHIRVPFCFAIQFPNT